MKNKSIVISGIMFMFVVTAINYPLQGAGMVDLIGNNVIMYILIFFGAILLFNICKIVIGLSRYWNEDENKDKFMQSQVFFGKIGSKILINGKSPKDNKKKDKAPNFAIGLLMKNNKIEKCYLTSSNEKDKITIPGTFENIPVVICEDVDKVRKILPIYIQTPDGHWFIPKKKNAYVEKSATCCERRILAYILLEHEKELSEYELIIYSTYEPCSYCTQEITRYREKFKDSQLNVYYRLFIENVMEEIDNIENDSEKIEKVKANYELIKNL